MDLIKLTLVSMAGWMNQQQQDVIDYYEFHAVGCIVEHPARVVIEWVYAQHEG